MKTFDIALEYLDKLEIPIVIQEKMDELDNLDDDANNLIQEATSNFLADPRNNKSNDYYKKTCFLAALIHCIFKKNNLISFFDVACTIIEEHKDILQSDYEKFAGTVYPKLMVDQWLIYCNQLKKKTDILEGEMRENLFFTAYHYTIEPEIA